MQRISSNSTLFFKFFIPIFWLVFFGATVLAIFAYGEQLAGGLDQPLFKLGAVLFYLSGLALFYFTLFPLKRIELDADYAYVTNYFKTYRYPWHNVVGIRTSSFLFLTVARLELQEGGAFGQRIPFIASRRLLESFQEEHPGLLQEL